MKDLTLYILMLILFSSCRIGDVFTQEKVTLNQKELSLRLPKGYDKFIISANQRLGYRFVYEDSTTVYINRDELNPNQFRVKKSLGDSVYAERFKKNWLIPIFPEDFRVTDTMDLPFLDSLRDLYVDLDDTMDLSGLDTSTGLYFRDLKINEISYGYFNVRIEDKELFDRVIGSKLNDSGK